MSSPDPTREYKENELPEDKNDDFEMSPAERWNKIMEIMETLQTQCKDLQESLEDFNKSATFPL